MQDNCFLNNRALNYINTKHPKCTLCNEPITFQDYIDTNYYFTIPKKSYYELIFVHKTCIFRNIKGG